MKPIAPMKPELHAIIARVEQVRKELDLSKSALARLIGMKAQTYNNFIGGQGSKPSVELVLGVVDKCGVHADWLLRGVGPQWRGLTGIMVRNHGKSVPVPVAPAEQPGNGYVAERRT